MSEPEWIDLGRAPFAPIHAQMLASAAEVAAGAAGRILLVEHLPVYTAGRATLQSDLTADMVPIERGGQITYHGPGQLVVYPILKLPRRDVGDWLRRLEAFGIAICASFQLEALPSQDGTGVFIGPHKVASIGVAVRRWVNLHGLAINVDMDLDAFHKIRPCGRDPALMSDLSRAAGHRISIESVKDAARSAGYILLAQPPT